MLCSRGFASRQDRLFVASAKCLTLLRGYYDARPEVLGAHGPCIARTVLKTLESTSSAPRLSQHLRSKAKSHGLATGAEAMLATSTKLLSALLCPGGVEMSLGLRNSKDSADWFRSFGEAEAPNPLKEEPKLKGKAKKEQLREAIFPIFYLEPWG